LTQERNEILAAAQRIVFAKGYERMTIQDILADLKISSGAFYHYFDSKPAVLEALVEQMQQEAAQPLLELAHDPHLNALEKLQRYFDTLDRSRIAQKAFIADLACVWFADDNAIIREKVDEAIVQRRAPLLTAIVHQGLMEGVFKTPYPDQAGELILALMHGMGNTLTRMLLAFDPEHDVQQRLQSTVTTHPAYMEAVERLPSAYPPAAMTKKRRRYSSARA
jgi:AcrR family transcriptional regulator